MSDKVDCVCGHEESDHLCWSNDSGGFACDNCTCKFYDPNGHNPEQLNFVCPKCRRTRMEHLKNFNIYYCYGCRSLFGTANELLALARNGKLEEQLKRGL